MVSFGGASLLDFASIHFPFSALELTVTHWLLSVIITFTGRCELWGRKEGGAELTAIGFQNDNLQALHDACWERLSPRTQCPVLPTPPQSRCERHLLHSSK